MASPVPNTEESVLFDANNQPPTLPIQTPIPRPTTMPVPTATPTPTPTPIGRRVRLSEQEKVELVRLCVHHQADHHHGNKKAFWSHISQLLNDKIGKLLRDPQQTVDALVTQFQAQIKRAEKESGTIQDSSKLKQALSEWVSHLEGQRNEAKHTETMKAEVIKEQNQTKNARKNLLRTWSQRSSNSSDTEIEEISPPPGPSSHSRARGRSRGRSVSARSMKSEESSLIEVMNENSGRMAAAIEKLAAAVAGASNNASSNASSNNASSNPSSNIVGLEERVARVEERMERNAEETKMLLRELLTGLLQQLE